MSALKKIPKKKLIIGIIALAVVIAIIVGVVYEKKTASTDGAREGTIEEVTVRSIANSISCSGTVVSGENEEVTLPSSSYSQEIKQVCVEVGDHVSIGDTICILDTEDLEENLADANEQLWDLRADQGEQDAEYDKQIREQEESIGEDVNDCRNNLATAATNLANAKQQLEDDQAEYDEYINDSDLTHNSMTAEAISMQNRIDSDKASVSTYQSQVDSYSKQLNELTTQDTSDLEDNKKDYDEQIDDQAEDIQDRIDDYKEQIAESTVKANTAGTVTELNAKAGSSSYTSSTVAVIENENTMMIEAQVDEYDIADVALGMNVLVRTDSTREQELEGTVSFIAPKASSSSSADLSGLLGGSSDLGSLTGSSSSSATFLVKINLNQQNERLRLGMNAKVSILTEEASNALSLPYDALQTADDGTYYVEVVTKGEDPLEEDFTTKKVKVSLGLEGSYYVEVISDQLEEGTKIFVPSTGNGTTINDLLNSMGADAGV